MVAVLESKTRISFPATKERWDLKDRMKFPQWHHDLVRIVKRSTTPTFLGSQPPKLEDSVYSSEGPTTRSSARTAAENFMTHTNAHACTVDEWMQHNTMLYDIIMASITLTEDQFIHVDQGVGQHSDGNALYEWVLTHADDR
ncbi:hypothetical protein AB1Y20_010118 [Prymnesium parvum]|uniref:Uncharacterized protein n=1 Tax=Prymnesium parvum TaxID=97485 RepID=A0AB34K6J1_PRYPA